VLDNQGLSAVAFFEATAFLILLVLFVLLRRDHPTRFLAVWLAGWSLLTLKAAFELTQVAAAVPQLRLVRVMLVVIVNFIFLKAVVRYTGRSRINLFFLWPGAVAVVLSV